MPGFVRHFVSSVGKLFCKFCKHVMLTLHFATPSLPVVGCNYT